MSTLVIIAHPGIQSANVNESWKKTIENRFELVTTHDLYTLYPDGKIDVEKEQKLVEQHDHIVFQYPMYWMNYPPLLQKWFDEVYTNGWAFKGGSALKDKYFGLAISCGQPENHYSHSGPIGYTIDEVVTPLKAVINLVGGRYFGLHAMYDTDNIGNFADIAENADQYIAFLEKLERQ
ncbi:NAD(P)H-dependent oxidoreductase [Staphylococcus carnosus]|uniref:NADPH oxidoreductase n=1 Tax=Staphylococcus carnosus (strain TM300) TaxID=396513 RepID=B9DL15_STACT|nr:NAD(P)H-dependent oxidoreductase [Staphylococcus carnosus]KOR13005.1 NADPH oxidoreductase [Staphylococcus carnosus]QPT04956.1 NAD(P)H-dependent oxidoreductase [Staphylococcus carnosus]UQA67681.1 NAD(P)H-dependent oxidoreductase [Staphylococcus carnosus]UTB77492.1 NADPH oxidoreductase [Staphylococcus carnosus]UTB87036.1 NADPH oxidoreductase [Staphylococcus carnosus]